MMKGDKENAGVVPSCHRASPRRRPLSQLPAAAPEPLMAPTCHTAVCDFHEEEQQRQPQLEVHFESAAKL